MTSFEGERVLVTGGRRGLGRAFAEALATRGAAVTITSRAALAKEHGAPGDGAALSCDLWDMHDTESTRRLEASLKREPPSVVIHCAHDFPEHVPVVGLRADDLARAVAAYASGTHALFRLASRLMMRGGRGRLVLMSSLAVEAAPAGQAAYVASKLAAEGITRVLASEVHDRGVGSVIVRAGIVDTENVRARVSLAAREHYAQASGLGRLLTVTEVVEAVLPFLDFDRAPTRATIVRIGSMIAESDGPVGERA